MRPSRLAPYPYDVLLTHPEVGTAGLMLSDGGQGKVIRHRHKGLDQVTPTSYSYGAQSPFRARQSIFARLLMGYGQPVQLEENSQRYDHAVGMDWSCGLGVLPTRWSDGIAVGAGPIKDIKQMMIGTTRHLFVLSGDALYDSTAATIDDPTDFTLLRNFRNVPPPPVWPTPGYALPGPGGAGTLEVWYRVQLSANQPPNPPFVQSAIGPELHLTTAPNTITPTNPVVLHLPPNPYGMTGTLYKSLDHVNWGAVLVGITPPAGADFTDDGSMPVTGTTVFQPAIVGPAPYQLWAGFYDAPLLLVGMDSASFWMWDGTTWTWSLEQGRVLVQQGYNTYRSSRSNPTDASGVSTRTNINAAYSTTIHPKFGGTGGGTPNWPLLYQSLGQTPITRLAAIGDVLLVCEEQRIAIGAAPVGAGPTNTAISLEITPERTSPPSADNGRCGTVWQGSFYTPYGNAFYKITPTSQRTATVEAIGPERLIENTSAVKGRVTALAGWGAWHLFYALWDGATSYLCKWGAWTNPELANSPGAQLLPVPHGAIETWPTRVNWLEIAEAGEPALGGNPRLYAGFVDGTLRWTTLPAQSPFAPTDPACRYRSSGFTVLSRHTMGFQLDGKRYQHLTAFGPLITPTSRVRYFYTLPDGSERELSGEVTENGAPLDFPLNVEGKWIQIRVELETDDPTVTPIVEGFALEEQLNPASIEEISFSAHVGPHVMLASRHPTRRSAALLLATLRRLEGRGDDVLLTLPDGTVQRVAIIDLADHYLSGDSFAGERHEVGLTLVTFKTNTPTPLFGGL